jgi:hypothetical protein
VESGILTLYTIEWHTDKLIDADVIIPRNLIADIERISVEEEHLGRLNHRLRASTIETG